MKLKIVCLMAGLAVLTPAFVQAEETKPEKRPSREELREKFKNMTPEEREAKMKEWREKNPDAQQGPRGAGAEQFRARMTEMAIKLGLKPDELEKLSREERQAKFREAAAAKGKELKSKKEAGTITDEEQKLLDQLREMKQRGEEFRRQREGDGAKDGKEARKPAIQDEKK